MCRRSLVAWVPALVALLVGCSAALTDVTPEQAAGLKDAQRIADEVTRAYGAPRVRVFSTSQLRPGSGAGYSYAHDWIFIRPELLTGTRFRVVLTHELGHVTLGHRPTYARSTKENHTAIAEKERAANRRGVEIMVRSLGVTEQEALGHYAEYFIEANRVRKGRMIFMPVGHPAPCEQLRDLWSSFGQMAPVCEIETAQPAPTGDTAH